MSVLTVFDLRRDAFGRLVLTDAEGREHVGVVAVRAFPISAPDEGVSVVDGDGHELAWVPRLDALDEARRTLLTEALEQREFMPRLLRVTAVSSFATPSTWSVETDRGPTSFVLKGEEDIRRIGAASLLIADNHGIHFLIRDMFNIDKTTRKILDRFL